LKKLEHPNIIRLYGVREEPEYHLLAMELGVVDLHEQLNLLHKAAEKRNPASWRGGFAAERCHMMFKQVVDAVE
jgi:hypothetical protein